MKKGLATQRALQVAAAAAVAAVGTVAGTVAARIAVGAAAAAAAAAAVPPVMVFETMMGVPAAQRVLQAARTTAEMTAHQPALPVGLVSLVRCKLRCHC